MPSAPASYWPTSAIHINFLIRVALNLDWAINPGSRLRTGSASLVGCAAHKIHGCGGMEGRHVRSGGQHGRGERVQRTGAWEPPAVGVIKAVESRGHRVR